MNATTNNAGSNLFATTLLGNQGAASYNPMTTNGGTGTVNPVPNANPLPNPWGAAGGMKLYNSSLSLMAK